MFEDIDNVSPEVVEPDEDFIEPEDGEEAEIDLDDDDGEAEPSDDDDEQPLKGQDPKVNKAFADLRRRAEAAERKVQEAAQKVEQFEAQTRQQAETKQTAQFQQVEQQIATLKAGLSQYGEQVRQQYLAQNYDPAIAEVFAKQAVLERKDIIREAESTLKEQKMAEQAEQAKRNTEIERFKTRFTADYEALKAKFGDIVPEIEKLGDAVAQRVLAGESLKAVWIDENFDKIAELKAKTAAKAAKTQAQSKTHLKGEQSGGSDVDRTAVPADIYSVYKQMNPKWTDAEIAKDYKKYNKKRK